MAVGSNYNAIFSPQADVLQLAQQKPLALPSAYGRCRWILGTKKCVHLPMLTPQTAAQ